MKKLKIHTSWDDLGDYMRSMDVEGLQRCESSIGWLQLPLHPSYL